MAKTENYSAEVLAKIIEDYNAGMSIADLSDKYTKPAKSLIAKLAREGVYRKAEKPVNAEVDTGPTKKELARVLVALVPDFPVDKLMPATKEAFEAVIALARAKIAETEGETEVSEGEAADETEAA